MAVDPTGVLGWAINKILDGALEYVKEAKKYVDHCEDLERLLAHIKPLISQATEASVSSSSSSSASSETSSRSPNRGDSAVDEWLRSLEPLLKEAEETLEKALERVKKGSLNLYKKKKYSGRVLGITERIRKTCQEEVGLAILAELRSCILASRGREESGKAAAPAADVEDPLTLRLRELRRRRARDERCRVRLEIADTHTPRFHIPGDDHQRSGGGTSNSAASMALEEEDQMNEVAGHRGRVSRGGIEVNNSTKLRLTIHVDFEEDWFFYLLFLDHNSSQLSSKTPELYFPEEDVDGCNSLNRKSKRVFPDPQEYDDDPPTVKLSRSSNVPTDACEQVSLYLLLVSSRLKPGDPLQKITIQDVQNHLETPDLDIIIKHWMFDIKPSHQPN